MASSTITVYEQERQKNIERNKSLLAELGLGDARRQLIETHANEREREEKKDAGEKIKRRYTKKTFMIDTPRRSARIQGKPVRYADDFGSDEGEEDDGNKLGKRKYSFYAVDPEEARPKYKNELTTCHFCRKRDRKPKTRCGTCGVKYWVGDCCRSCFEQHFDDEDFDEVMMDKNWVCYCCRKRCPCMECIAGITKGRRYGPRKVTPTKSPSTRTKLPVFKDPTKDGDYSVMPMPFSGVPAEQYNLFSPLPLPSFFNYPHNGIPQFNLPMPTNPFNSLPSPSSPPFSQHTFSSYSAPGLFAASSSSSSSSSPHHTSSYAGGFPTLHSAFGGNNGCVSPQNIFGISPLPPPNPHPSHPHYMGSTHSFMGTRDANNLDTGAACGYKMAQVIAQITNSPSYSNSNFIHTNFPPPPPPPPPMVNNNPFASSKKKRGRKPKNFLFGMHSSESVSSDPMSSNDMIFEPPPLDILPPIKIPLKRGKKPGSYLPALSVEEEALSASLNMSNGEEGTAEEEPSGEEPEDGPEVSAENDNRRHNKRRTFFDGRRVIISKKHFGKKVKSEPTTLPPLPNMLDSPMLLHQFSNGQEDDEYFQQHRGSDVVDEDDEDDYLNDINSDIFDDLEKYGFVSRGVGKGKDEINRNKDVDDRDVDGDDEEEQDEEGDEDGLDFEDTLAAELNEAPAKAHKKKSKSKRSKKSVKTTDMGTSPIIKIEKGSSTPKRKQAKSPAPPLKEESTSPANLRRSARPPRASRVFDDNYIC